MHKTQKIDDKLILNIFTIAFSDYIDARMLIRENRLLNGGHLSALASEKLLKAMILALNLQPVHVHLDNVKQLVNQVSKPIPDFRNYINIEFLQFLGRIFRMRYYPDKYDESICISRNKLLWEIDRLFDQFHNMLKFDPPDVCALYTQEKKLNNIMIYEENQWLEGKHEITELETYPDFLEAIYRSAGYGITASVRKEFPKTFVNCKMGEELKIDLGKKQV